MGTTDEITRLREGSMIDYNMETWEVTGYDTYDDTGWPADVWTLESGTDVVFLEHEYDGGDVFRVARPARISDITVENPHGPQDEPFLAAVREGDAPGTIRHQGQTYVLAEEDARVDTDVGVTNATRNASESGSDKEWTRSVDDWWLMGVCGGYAEQKWVSSTLIRFVWIVLIFPFGPLPFFFYLWLGLSKPLESNGAKQDGRASEDKRTHYWVYEKGGDFVALECHGYNDWDAYTGREVEPDEFDNILPGSDN